MKIMFQQSQNFRLNWFVEIIQFNYSIFFFLQKLRDFSWAGWLISQTHWLLRLEPMSLHKQLDWQLTCWIKATNVSAMAIALRRLTNTRKCNVTTTCCAARSESKWFLAVTGAILPNTKSKIKQSLLFQNDTEIFTTIAQWINISKIFSGISCFAIQTQNLIKMMGHHICWSFSRHHTLIHRVKSYTLVYLGVDNIIQWIGWIALLFSTAGITWADKLIFTLWIATNLSLG